MTKEYSPKQTLAEIAQAGGLLNNRQLLDIISHCVPFQHTTTLRIDIPQELLKAIAAEAGSLGMELKAYILILLYQIHSGRPIQLDQEALLSERIRETNETDQTLIEGRSLETVMQYVDFHDQEWEPEP